jgi:hypothetical protein
MSYEHWHNSLLAHWRPPLWLGRYRENRERCSDRALLALAFPDTAKRTARGEIVTDHKNIFDALNAVMQQVGYVQKSRTPSLNYSFAGEAALIAAIRPYLVENGIVVVPAGIREMRLETYETKNGATMNRTVAIFAFMFAHGPSDTHIIVEVMGEGADGGDKSANKAMTGAYKYALRQALMIETGDDPDAESSDHQERAAPKAQPGAGKPAATPEPAIVPVRPYDPATLVKGIARLVTNSTKTGAVTDKQRGTLTGRINGYFSDREEPDKARYLLLNFLFGVMSSQSLVPQQIDALFTWTDSEHAITEARAAVRYIESGNAASDAQFNEAFPKASGF